MKKLLFILLLVPLVSFGQIKIDQNRLYLFLDYVSNSMKGDPVNQLIYQGKKAIYASDYDDPLYDNSNIDGNAEMINQAENDDGTYKYVLHNKKVGKYLGIDFKSFEGAFIYSTIIAMDSDKEKTENIVSIDTSILFMRRNVNNNIINNMERKLIYEFDKYFKNICTTGLVNNNVSYNKKTTIGLVDKNQTFQILGKQYVEEKYNDDYCSDYCDNCYTNFDIGFQTSGVGINDGYSHILHIKFTNITNKAISEVNGEIHKVLKNN